jgi:hypothetical protein
MGMKNSEKTRFLTTSPRKMIFDILLVFTWKLQNAKIHKNVEYFESKFSLFLGEKNIRYQKSRNSIFRN